MTKANPKRHIPSGTSKCERCAEWPARYCVESEDGSGALNIVVCGECAREATRIHLSVTELPTLTEGRKET